MTRRGLVVAALVVLATAGVVAQQVFRAGTDVVSLAVTVTDANDRFIAGLPQGAFQVFEDGVEQDISFFSNATLPIALSLLVDTSASMENKLAIAQDAARGFTARLQPDDLAQIVSFDSRVDVLQPFTADKAALDRAIGKITAGGSTSLYNAIYVAISELKRARAAAPDTVRRQAIIVLSDGEDTSSLVAYDEVLDQAKRSEVIIYAIGLRSKHDVPTQGFNEADYVLRTLAQQTGGRAFFVEQIADLSGVYQEIADELAHQYTIGYRSKNPMHDGAWRTVIVRVARDDAIVRTKRGYYAPSK